MKQYYLSTGESAYQKFVSFSWTIQIALRELIDKNKIKEKVRIYVTKKVAAQILQKYIHNEIRKILHEIT